MNIIPFNKPFITGNEIKNISNAIELGKLAGDGEYTRLVQQFFKSEYGINKSLLTTSCTDALEMCAILSDIDNQCEVIIPSYTFVSTANAFALRGAKIVFADSESLTPNIDTDEIESLITSKTKVIVAMHYGGVACDMDSIVHLASKYNLTVIEDAAQAIDSYYKGKPLGSIGSLGSFSFHETKNIICGEGGLLTINDKNFVERAEIIREKGTNRSKFFRGEVDKYNWVDIGSSFLASDIVAAFLLAQLNQLSLIQQRRIKLWERYNENLEILNKISPDLLPHIHSYATNNAHMYYLTCSSLEERGRLIDFLLKERIVATFHYLPLHSSPFFKEKYNGRELKSAERWANCLVRLPLYADLEIAEVDYICEQIRSFFNV
jgi:dTDP-4-amino-4,6-dideoxygalactose transaminase